LVADGWRTPNTYTNGEFGALPDAPGVYMFSYKEDLFDPKGTYRVVYVGKSNNLRKRHIRHPIRLTIEDQAGQPAHVMCWFKEMPADAITQAEIDLIQKYDPSLNIVHRVRKL